MIILAYRGHHDTGVVAKLSNDVFTVPQVLLSVKSRNKTRSFEVRTIATILNTSAATHAASSVTCLPVNNL